jgi:hypothetical protein
MRDYIDIGSSPPGEECAQLGSDGYWSRANRECRAYIALLRRALGREPEDARLAIKENEHDFGTYLSVICHYESTNETSATYAFRCESEGPEYWDDEARDELVGRKENR